MCCLPWSAHRSSCTCQSLWRDQVLAGYEGVAEAGGFVSANIFSSVSGTVKAIEPRMTPAGAKVNSIVIENDGEFKEVVFEAKPYDQMFKDDVLAAIKEAGIVGLGGAGFPTHVELAPKDPDAIEYIIVNGAEVNLISQVTTAS